MSLRNLDGASTGNIFADWRPRQVAPNKVYDLNLPLVRARARDLETNNPLIARYLAVLANNVIGSVGIGVKNNLFNRKGNPSPDNAKIDDPFNEWASSSESYSYNGCYDRIEGQRLILNCLARDGAVIRRFDFQDGFKVEILEIDYLAERMNEVLPSGNRVVNGVEFTRSRKPVAIWLYEEHPLDYGRMEGGRYEAVRHPMEFAQIISMCNRPGQVVGVPWLSAAMSALRMMDKFLEAELVAARISASKAGFYKASADADPNDYKGDGVDNEGRTVSEVFPGQWEKLPYGVEAQLIDPTHPNTTAKEFVDMITRYSSSGLKMSYHTLGNDLTGVNYSSSRAGTLEDREEYLKVMRTLYRQVALPEKKAWFDYQVLSGGLDIRPDKAMEIWKPKPVFRRWPWVDPLKDREAVQLEIQMGMMSPQDACEEYEGRDPYETLAEIAEYQNLAAELGVKLPAYEGVTQKPQPEQPQENPAPVKS